MHTSFGAAIWRPQPFPAPTEVIEEQLRQRLELDDPDDLHEQMLLIACRRDDDRPVGSVETTSVGWRFGELVPWIDPLASAVERASLVDEFVRILVPWMLDERHMMTVTFHDIGMRQSTNRTAIELGGRLAIRHREAHLLAGKRSDTVEYQFFNKQWIEQLGPPPAPEFGEVKRHVATPTQQRRTASGTDWPDDAVVMGKHLHLRVLETDRGDEQSSIEWAEEAFSTGDRLLNRHGYNHNRKKHADPDSAESVTLAVALNETDEMIGRIALTVISWVHQAAVIERGIFRPHHHNTGFEIEADHLLLEYAFDNLGMHVITSLVAEADSLSITSLTQQGYRRAGSIAWDLLCEEGFCSSLSFDLLAEEWRSARDTDGS